LIPSLKYLTVFQVVVGNQVAMMTADGGQRNVGLIPMPIGFVGSKTDQIGINLPKTDTFHKV